MSPIGNAFRNYCRMYPALINNTTINWFMRWPEDALTEVAQKFVGQMDVPDEFKDSLAKLCCYAHSTVIQNATLMQQELRRIFYVTPTNYLELLRSYDNILKEKRTSIGNQINKLRNGLSKLEFARQEVEEMTAESKIKRADVAQKTKASEDLMVDIKKDQKTADEKEKYILSETDRINKEKDETEKLAADAEAELAKAMPALVAANQAIESLDKKSINEIKSYASPPQDVLTVMNAVMTMLGKEQTWMSAKKELADIKFIEKIMFYDKDNMGDKTIKAIEKYTKMDNFYE